ncbi:hypothetical protein KHC28_03265 [Ancylobacter sonchi]|uniref:hypothetical protein n=1 Tax=Ancylobacter sonchi TaxID=1937790 RepID=UPI001BD3B493|nr:hypothetical protein [Ancylobacter sonchi]MBS7532673.1 hypothetical protein [Ancylobacter sonchi]
MAKIRLTAYAQKKSRSKNRSFTMERHGANHKKSKPHCGKSVEPKALPRLVNPLWFCKDFYATDGHAALAPSR